jgi:hypothetical protein
MSDEASRVKLLETLSGEARMLLKGFLMEANAMSTAQLLADLLKRMCLLVYNYQPLHH